jgi:hypothetical protein
LKVPNTALRFQPVLPSAEFRALYAKHAIKPSPSEEVDEGSPGKAPAHETAIVWKLMPDKSLDPVQIELGITDHAYTEILAIPKGELKTGDNVITASMNARAQGR